MCRGQSWNSASPHRVHAAANNIVEAEVPTVPCLATHSCSSYAEPATTIISDIHTTVTSLSNIRTPHPDMSDGRFDESYWLHLRWAVHLGRDIPTWQAEEER